MAATGAGWTETVPRETDVELHQKAKKAIYDKEWVVAIRMLNRLDAMYPESTFRVEALYWMAYSLEKLSHVPAQRKDQVAEKEEAMRRLEDLLETTENNPWLDDAKILRIRLAEDLVKLGKKDYRKHIEDAARTDDKEGNDLKMVALDALIRVDRKQALELLAKMYIDAADAAVRENVIFILRRAGDEKTINQLLDVENRKGSISIMEFDGRVYFPERKISPPQVIRRVPVDYPKEALKEGISGQVVVKLLVDRRGRVIQTDILGDPHPLLKEAAVKSAKQWRYKPFTRGSARHRVTFKVNFQFYLIEE
jgi:TonB family protein